MKNKITVTIVSLGLASLVGGLYLSNSDSDDSHIEIQQSAFTATPNFIDDSKPVSKTDLLKQGETPKLQMQDLFADINQANSNIPQKEVDKKALSKLVSVHIAGINQNLLKLVSNPNDALAKQLIEGEVIELKNLHSNSLEILKGDMSTEQLAQVSSRFNGIIALLENVSTADSNDIASKAMITLAWTKKHRRTIALMDDEQRTVTSEFTPIRSENDIVEGTPPVYETQITTDSANVSSPKAELQSFSLFSTAYAATLQTPSASAASCSYNSADLEESLPEVAFTAEVKQLAESLGYSPVRIYEYLKNNIQYDPYYGSLKGASMTLKSGSGNSTDQASLFISLLRYSGFPARYVKGEIQFDDDSRGRDWIGAKTNKAAARIYSRGHGISEYYSNVDRLLVKDHVWVATCIPYDNYRSTSIDATGYSWLPLDVSFKEMTFVQGTVVPDGFKFDYDAFLSERHIEKPVDILIKQIEEFIGTAVDGFGYQGTIKKQEMDVLPSTLPYRVNKYVSWEDSTSSEAVRLPEKHKYKVELSLYGLGLTFNSATKKLELTQPSMYSSSGKVLLATILDNPLSLSSRPLSGTNIWNSWVNGNEGDFNRMCDLNLVPELFVGNKKINMGSLNEGTILNRVSTSLPAGYNSPHVEIIDACSRNYKLNIRVTLKNSKARPDVAWNNIQPINDHVLQIYGYHSTDKYIDTKVDQLISSIGGSISDFDITQKDKLEVFLDIVGLKYMHNMSEDSKTIGKLYGGNGLSGLHVGLVSTRQQVNFLFDLPMGISGSGFLVDVPGGASQSVDLVTAGLNLESFILAGFASSAEESYIWQELAYMDAVSTVRGIQLANEQYKNDSSKSVFRLETSADVTAKLNRDCPADLKYSATEIEDFQTLLSGHADNYMLIPECKILYDNWQGQTYFAFTNKGEEGFGARYSIGGDYVDGANGGYATGRTFSSSNLNRAVNLAVAPSSFGFVSGSSNLTSSLSVPLTTFNNSASSWAPDQFLLTGGNTGTSSFSSFAGDPVNLLSGNMYHYETDIDISGRGGLNFVFERHYNSHNRNDGPLGIGWTHNLNQSLTFNDDDADAADNESQDKDGKTSSIVWKDSSGALIVFENIGINTSGIVNKNQTFKVLEGKHITAKRLSGGLYEVKLKGGIKLQFQSINGTIGQIAKLVKIIDRSNNQLTLSYDASTRLKEIKDQLNRKLKFYYVGANKHIDYILDWSGRVYSYEYDTSNHLTEYKNPLASSGNLPPIRYDYYPASAGIELAHAMKSITDAGGSTMTWQYYLNGKVFRTINQQGKTYTFTYNLLRRETETVNEKGQKEIALFNEFGRMIKKTYADGAFEEWEYAATNPNLQTEYRGTDGLRIKYQYGVNENLSKTTFPSGNYVQNLNYNSQGKATKFRTANGNYLLKRYYANGGLKEELILNKGVNSTVPTPSQISSWVKYAYNSYGDRTKTTQVTDFRLQTGPYLENIYSSDGLKLNKVKLCGRDRNNDGVLDVCDENYFQFDSLGRVIASQIRGVNKKFSFSETNKIVKIETSQISNPLFKVIEEREYNEIGLVQRIIQTERTDNEIKVLSLSILLYDSLNRLAESIQGNGASLIYKYDEIGNAKLIVNENGESVHYKYDSHNRRISVTDEEGKQLQKLVYGVNGQLKRSVNKNDKTTQYIYYGAQGDGRLKEKRYQNGLIESWVYDAEGNILSTTIDSITNPGTPYQTNIEYDSQNRATLILGPTHNSVVVDQNKNIRTAVEIRFDTFGSTSEKLVGYALPGQQSQAMKRVVNDRFDAGGLLLISEDQLGNKSNYFYDTTDNLIKTIHRDNIYTTNDYSSNNNLEKVSILNNSNSLLMDTVYTRALFNDEVESVSQNNYQPPQFLSSNERTSIKNSIDYNIDLNGLTIGVDQKIGEHSKHLGIQVLQPYKYKYDAEGRLVQVADLNKKKTQYSYEINGNLANIKLSNGEHINFVYDNKGRLIERKFSTGFGTRYEFDSENHLVSINNYKAGGAEISKHSYTYDWAGRKSTSYNTTRGLSTAKTFLTTYTYDRKNRILSENIYKKTGWNQSVNISDTLRHLKYNFNYDINDNMYTKSVQCFSNTGLGRGQVDYSYSYNVSEQLILLKHKGVNIPSTGEDCEGFRNHSWQNVTYTYDKNGSLKSEQRAGKKLIYGYDALNRLQSASGTNIKDDEVVETYEYDYLDRRVRKTAGNKETIYFYSGDQIVASIEKSKGESKAAQPIPDIQYIYAGLDTPIASIDSTGKIVYFYQDGFNSVTAAVKGNGVVKGVNIFTAWGESIVEEGDTGIFSYTGREKDDSLLMYYRNRYYNPSKGRFTQQDPAGYEDALNLYSYVGNSPTLYDDPFGLSISSSSTIQKTFSAQEYGYINTTSLSSTLSDLPFTSNASVNNSSLTTSDRITSIIGEFGNTASAFVDVLGTTDVGAVFAPALFTGATAGLVEGGLALRASVGGLIKTATSVETKITISMIKKGAVQTAKTLFVENKFDLAVMVLSAVVNFKDPGNKASVLTRRGGGAAESVSNSRSRTVTQRINATGPKHPGSKTTDNKKTGGKKKGRRNVLYKYGNDLMKKILDGQ